MKLKEQNGKVPYLYQAGKDLVSATMESDVAQRIVQSGKRVMTEDHPGYPLCVDKVWFFPVEEAATKQKAKSKKSDTKE